MGNYSPKCLDLALQLMANYVPILYDLVSKDMLVSIYKWLNK